MVHGEQKLQVSHRELLQLAKNALQKPGSGFKMDGDVKALKKLYLLKMWHTETNVDIDLSVNKILEVENSSLIKHYVYCDVRFHKLAYVLKEWNKTNNPNPMYRINSYGISLMLIGYLQIEGVLPNLQHSDLPLQEVWY